MRLFSFHEVSYNCLNKLGLGELDNSGFRKKTAAQLNVWQFQNQGTHTWIFTPIKTFISNILFIESYLISIVIDKTL